jgi:ADP-ribose pyrophosphatase YjhB (NUDIX family)
VHRARDGTAPPALTEYRFCPVCATPLELRRSEPEEPERPACPACGFVHYDNPAPTVQAWIRRGDGCYLALRRDREPLRGRWNMPGGFVEAYEAPVDAIRREVDEETGLAITGLELIGAFASRYGPEGLAIVDLAYHCELDGPDRLEVSEESSEGRWFALYEFPEPAFDGEREALALLRARAGGSP